MNRWHDWHSKTLTVIALALLGIEGLSSSSSASAQASAAEDRMRWIDAYVEGSRALEAGDLARAKHQLDLALSLAPENPATLHQNAALAARRGEIDAAIGLLEQAVACGLDDAALLEWDPDLESARGDSRFAALVERARSAARPAATTDASPSVPIGGAGEILALSVDGTRAAVASETVISVVDLDRDGVIASFARHGDRPRRLEFSADRARLFVESERRRGGGGLDVFTLEFDLASRRRVDERCASLDAVAGFPIAPIDRFTVESKATASSNVTRVIDAKTVNVIAEIQSANPLQQRAVAEDGTAVLLGSYGLATVYGVDVKSGVVSTPMTDAPLRLALGFVGRTRDWFAVRDDGTTTIHSFDATSEVRELRLEFEPLPNGSTGPSARLIARTDPTGRILLVQRDFADLSAFSLAEGRLLWSSRGEANLPCVRDFAVAGESVLIESDEGRLSRLDLESGKIRGGFTPPVRSHRSSRRPPFMDSDREFERNGVSRAALDRAWSSLGGAVVRCAAAYDGEIWIGTEPATIRVFRAGESEPEATIDFRDLDVLRTVEVGTLAISPNGNLVAVGSIGFGMVATYDRATRQPRWQFDYGGGNGSELRPRFSADGAWLAVSGQSPRNSRIVDAKDGSLILDLRDRGIWDLRPTNEESRVLATGEHGVEVLEVPSGRIVSRMFELEDGELIEHSPSGFVFANARSLARVHRLMGTGSDDLATLAPYLLDLKKIRASAAGVAIAPPFLPE